MLFVKDGFMQKKKFLLLLGLLMLSVGFIVLGARLSTSANPTEDIVDSLDWNLPVAVSLGIEPDQLALLSDDELRMQ